MRTSFKNSLFFFVFFLFAFWTGELTAQKHIAIDSKGTLKEITSSQVSTTVGVTPLNPNEGDVWIDTASNTVKIWEESAVPAWSEVASIRNWISLSNSGAYGIDHLVSYNGSIYKNLTGTNSDTTPNLDVTNWKSIGGGDIVPLWKSTTSGGSYATNDIINYNGTLYKNTTGTNSDTTPDLDTTNWINLEQITKVNGEFIREGDLIKAVGLESVTGGTVVFVEGTDPTLSNIELAFDGDNETVANLYISSFSRHNYELPSVLNVSKVELNYSSPADSSNVIIRLLDATDTILEEITPPELLASQGTVKLKYEMNVSGVAKVQIFDPSGSRTNINEISLYTLENSLAIPNVDIGDTLYLEDYGYTTLLSNLDGNVTLRATTLNEVPRWVSNTNGGTYNTESIINHQGTLYKNLTGTNSDTTPDADATNWESIGGGDIVPLWKSSTNGGSYATNDIINYNGDLYKNLTGTNTDTTPDADATNWEEIKSEISSVPAWKSLSNGGSYNAGEIINYDGTLYKNILGTNTDTEPPLDVFNWVQVSYLSIPTWKPSSRGGDYNQDDIINFAGTLYKNITGTNTNTSPHVDATNWQTEGASGGLAKQYLVAKHSGSSFSVTNGMTYPYNTTVASEGNDIINNGDGTYTLKAGNTYKLTANIGRFTGTGYVAWKWYNQTTNAYIDTGSSAQQWGNNYTDSYSDGGTAFAIVRPEVDTTVYLRQSTGTTTASMYTSASNGTARMYIEVLETSSIGGTGLATYDINRDYQLNDSIEKDGLIYKANGTIPAGTTFAEGTTGETWTALTTAAVQGTKYQYLVAKYSASAFNITNGMTYPYNTTVASEGNDIINNGNGTYTLKAGNTYKLTANIGRFSGTGYVAWKWYNGTTNAYIDTGSSAQQWGGRFSTAENTWTDSGIALAIVRPDVDTTVYLRQSSGTTTAAMSTESSYGTARMYIEVLETSSIGGTGLAVYNSGNDYLLNDTVIKDGVIYQANGAVPAGTTFAEGTTGATWKKVGEGDTVPIWKSNTSGGSYATNDIINYNGVLYKNLTGTNTDSTPNSDTTNWAASEKSVHYVSATRIESIGGDTTETGTGIYRWDVTNGYGSVGFTVTNNNERFTPDRAGLYSVILTGRGGDNDRYPQLRIRMNGTRISGADGTRNDFAPHDSITTHWIGYLSTTDYIDAEILHGWTGGASAQISILGL